tara:strand:+ start:94 stop:645 length:552 start_codon:yes stop_codon:yes gene_type:complete
MKKLLLLLFIPTLLTAQYSKRELKQKDKWLKKLELRIINRGVDFTKTFVFYVDKQEDVTAAERIAVLALKSGYERNWEFVTTEFENAMFYKGIETGTYQFKQVDKGSRNNMLTADNMIVNGEYLFEFSKNVGTYAKISVKDVENNFKTVATIQFRNNLGLLKYALNQTILIEHIVGEFINSGD